MFGAHSDTYDMAIYKYKNKYMIKDKSGSVISSVSYYDYDLKDFNWVLIANVETEPPYRNKGLATELMNNIYSDITNDSPNNGLYVFVKQNNHDAIRLYKKLGYNSIREYAMKDGLYYIMCKGKADVSQFNKMQFC